MAPPTNPGLAYRAGRAFMGLALRVYYREISVEGLERFPREGALLVAANHPNSLVDPMVLALRLPRPVRFLAKATLFVPGVRQLFESLGAIPVYRRQDDPGQVAKNRGTFAAAESVLKGGGAIGIFPEGVSHGEPRLKALKSGIARIALQAEAAEAMALGEAEPLAGLGVKIVPVGLHKAESARFRSRMAVRVGEPIAVADFLPAYHADERTGVEALLAALDARLKALVVHLEDDEVARAADEARALLAAAREARGQAGEFAAAVAEKQRLGAAFSALKAADPARWAALADRLADYRLRLAREHLYDSDLARAFDSPESRRGALWRALAVIALAPAALPGLLLNYPAYRLTGWLSPALSRDTDVFDTSRILFGSLLFLLEAGAVGWLVSGHFERPLWQGLLAAAGVLASGVAAMTVVALLKRLGRRLRLALLALFARPRLVRLRALRARLVGELSEFA